MAITIKEAQSGTVLAEAEAGSDALLYEGNWYFDPRGVKQEILRVTSRTYACPFKGTCHWVDYLDPNGRTVADVGWIYQDPRPGHEAIRGRFGFYAGSRGRTLQDG